MTDYDIVAYPHRPFAVMQPDKLAVVARMFGLDPVSPAEGRVLELGCASGGHLIPLADRFPEAFFHGVDLAQTAIEQGRSRIQKLGLRNIRLDAMDILHFPEDAGQFDYILCHGLLSWVPEAVQTKIFEICKRHLSPRGVVFISYNSYPGCYVRRMWREMMLFHTRQFTSASDKVQQAKQIWNLAANGSVRDDAPHRLAREAAKEGMESPDSAIFHDDLSPFWRPYYFHEFHAAAEKHGMRYLGGAIHTEQPPAVTGPALEALNAAGPRGSVAYEQYLDFFTMQQFRRSLLCHADCTPRQQVDPSALEGFHYSGWVNEVPVNDPAAPPGVVAFENSISRFRATTNNPVTIAILRALGDAWPQTCSFDQLVASANAPRDDVRQALLSLLSQFLSLHLLEVKPARHLSTKPEAWRVARLEASLDLAIPSLHHGSIELQESRIRKLITLMDGTRTVAELKAELGGADDLDPILDKILRGGVLVA